MLCTAGKLINNFLFMDMTSKVLYRCMLNWNKKKKLPWVISKKKKLLKNVCFLVYNFLKIFFQGFSILICFVLKAEVKLKSQSSKNVCTKKMLEDNFCSGSINSPISCKYFLFFYLSLLRKLSFICNSIWYPNEFYVPPYDFN